MLDREEIIEAIKQAAKRNGNKPLGREAFEKQTGIKIYECIGVYWLKWSDALKEAGFSPNTFNKRKDAEVIIEKIIEAVRYYKKIPTSTELRFYNRNVDKLFPSHSTIDNHFRTKANLIAKLIEYTFGKAEFKDVYTLCKGLNIPDKEDDKKQNVKEGYVYLFKSGDHYKIGNSYNVEQRVKQIKTQMPDSLTIVHTIRTDDPSGIEAYWHKRFDNKRANGEWFKLTMSDISAFKRRKFQ